MQTFYVDVYFLINFTVDILALYFAAKFAKIQSTVLRLIITSCIGAISACAVVLLNISGFGFLIILTASAAVIVYIFGGKISGLRRFKLFSAFMIFETLIGGAVNFSYALLDKFLYPSLREETSPQNRKLLILAILILFTFGVVKLIFLIFSGSKSERNIEIIIKVLEKEIKLSALIDTGNLVLDPMSARPVIFIKSKEVERVFPEFRNQNLENTSLKTRLRLIPIDSVGGKKILIGIRTDQIIFDDNKKSDNVVIAIDEDSGTYGGYNAIVPLSLLEEIV